MFQSLQALPPDPILGLTATFKTDANPNKIDLGMGVYKDGVGNTPIMKAVKQAEKIILQSHLQIVSTTAVAPSLTVTPVADFGPGTSTTTTALPGDTTTGAPVADFVKVFFPKALFHCSQKLCT